MKFKKAQAAMEFLMTYGWAILVVLVVIGALAYFGVLNPQQFLPKKCQFGTGIVCVDHIITEAAAGDQILLNNGMGTDIQVDVIAFDSDSSVADCRIAPGTVLSAGTETAYAWTCTVSAGTQGTRVKGNMTLLYTDLTSNIQHSVPGTLLTDIE
jgi:hypothetical protein